MSNKQFFNNLSATYADVRKLDVKKINLKGKNILEYIKESVPTIKYSKDTRETITEDDLWGQYIETKSDGTIIIHDDEVTNPNGSDLSAWDYSITKVEDNKAYTSSGFYANVQTEKIKGGDSMFDGCSQLTSFSSDLSSLTYSGGMFYNCNNLTSFKGDLSSLTNGQAMFSQCSQLTSFSSDLHSLTDGNNMFHSCSQLTSFSSDLPSLTNGSEMFYECNNLTSFNSDLSSLTTGYGMFYNCNNLTSFSSDLSNLTNGNSMFEYCGKLTSFSSDLPSLTNGSEMFYECNNLTSFNGDLSSLTTGNSMFNKCSLDAESVMYVADAIKNIAAEKQLYINGTIPYVTADTTSYPYKYSATKGFMSDGKYVYTYKNPQPYTDTISASNVGKLTLGINVINNADTIKQQLEDFAQEATFDSWADLKTHFSNKGWTVTFQYGGTDTSITYGLRGGEQKIPCPIFAKLIEIEPQGVEYDKDGNVIRENFYSDKQITRASYCNEDASTFYNIDWGHDVTDTSSYTQFNSLEDAMASWNVFPKENIISTEE